MKSAVKTGTILCSVIGLAICFYLLCYHFDNKYTHPGSEEVIFLVTGWELYPDVLLAPSDFAEPEQPQGVPTFIGQYGGFDMGQTDRSPHGSATYRLRIALPETSARYMLELPEIYSAYRLYCNGVLTAQMGEPEPSLYRAQTGNTTVTVEAGGSLDLLLAVTDYSHLYSGLVYPPMFGKPEAVQRLLYERYLFRIIFCVLALAVGLLHMALGLLQSKKNMTALLYGFCCFFFTGAIAYPVVKTLTNNGMAWYRAENFCYCAMLLTILLIQTRTANLYKRLSLPFIGFGAFVCFCALAVPSVMGSSLIVMRGYSLLIEFYIGSSAVCLTLGAALSLWRGKRQSTLLLCGLLIFDCALIFDRILPDYEPILLGWFPETGAAALVGVLGLMLGADIVRMYRTRAQLEGRMDSMSQIVELQRAYYPNVLRQVDEASRARHDLRHHFAVLRKLAAEGEKQALLRYVDEYKGLSDEPPVTCYCENFVIDLLLRHFAALAEKKGIALRVQANLTEQCGVTDAELCTIVSNLMENALNACVSVRTGAWIELTLNQLQDRLGILVKNSYTGTAAGQKAQKGEGIGLLSVRLTAERLGGTAVWSADAANGVFESKIVLPVKVPSLGR